MKEFNFDDFQEAWDAQEKEFEKMELIHQEEVEKMIQDASEKEQKQNNQFMRNAHHKKWIWRSAVAACVVTVVVTTLMTLNKMSPIPESQIGISQDIISQTDEQLQNPEISDYEVDEQTELHGLSTTEANRHEEAFMLNESSNGSLSSTEAGRHESEVKTQYSTASTESDVAPYGATSDAYQMRPATEVDNYGHEVSVMSNRKCNVNKIVRNLQEIL